MTFVTLVSRICMKATTITVMVMAHLWAGEIGSASGDGVVTVPGGYRDPRSAELLPKRQMLSALAISPVPLARATGRWAVKLTLPVITPSRPP